MVRSCWILQERTNTWQKKFLSNVNKLSSFKHLVPELIKLPKNVTKVEALTENFLNAHGFPHCLGVIDGTQYTLTSQERTLLIT